MISWTILIVGIFCILAGLLYVFCPSYVLAFWRGLNVVSTGRFARLVGAIILIAGIVLLIYNFA